MGRKTKIGLGIYVIWIATVIVWAVNSAPTEIERHSWKYEGKVTFETEEEYGDFKRAMGSPDVNIVESMILSSAPPVVAEFEVRVAAGSTFPYGEGTRNSFPTSTVMLAVFLIVLPGIVWWHYTPPS